MTGIIPQRFGNEWTRRKLSCLQKYLKSYNIALKDKGFGKVYIDAFAGSGYRVDNKSDYFEENELEDINSYFLGSAKISLEIDPYFTKYFFIDNRDENIQSLNKIKQEYSKKDIEIFKGDANSVVGEICESINWNKNRGVIFLDPFGMQVDWHTLEIIANTKALDCWVLVPIGIAINRLLTTKGEPPIAWQNSLTRVLGTDQWKNAFYGDDPQPSLFSDDGDSGIIKIASFDKIGEFFLERMRTIFPGVIDKPLYLRNSNNNPLYALCFAVSNPSKPAIELALKLAKSIIGKEQDCG